MRYLLTLLFAALSFNAVGQSRVHNSEYKKLTTSSYDIAAFQEASMLCPQIGTANPGNTDGLCAPYELTFPISNTETNDPSTIYEVDFGDGSTPLILSHPPPLEVTHTYTSSSCGFTTPQGSQNSFMFKITAENECGESSSIVEPVRIHSAPNPIIYGESNVCIGIENEWISPETGVWVDANNCTAVYGNWQVVDPETGFPALSSDVNPVFSSSTSNFEATFFTAGIYIIQVTEYHPVCNSGSATFEVCVGCECVGEPLIGGCTNSQACNYNSAATDDDGSCDYTSCYVFGCLNIFACNYDPLVDYDDGTCDFTTCAGCTDVTSCDYDPTATISDAALCLDYTSCYGCLNISACNYDPLVDYDDGTCDFISCIVFDCTSAIACNYNSDADFDDGSCVWPDTGYNCNGVCLLDTDGDGVCDPFEVLGCTYSNASNYDPNATEDDGSCLYTGCMDSAACNFNPDATEDDGNCDYSCCPGPGCCDEGTYWNVDTQTCLLDITFCSWQPDSNADGNIGIGDLLDLLSVFGDTDYDEDGVFDSVDDCVDPEACNYQSNPTEPCYYIDVLGVCGGGCEADEDGDAICDDIDDCIGVIDECGVCNGPGATEIVIDNITILYDSVYLPQLEEWYVYEFGADTTFSFTCEPVFNSCGDDIGHEGYNYSTVQIGEQCWFSENCRYLPEVSPLGEGSETSPYYYVFGNSSTDAATAQFSNNYGTYGVLYNWPAVMTEGICPSGWHIPSDEEFTQLTGFLGGESVAGGKMKDDLQWDGSNSSGWTGLPGGYCYPIGNVHYVLIGSSGFWWSSSESGSDSWERRLDNYNGNVNRSFSSRFKAFSARCVRD